MRQEHRFVADVYRYLAPFIDSQRDIFLSLDGEAAKVGVAANLFLDSDVPDLWFTLIGSAAPTLLEAKICDGRAIKLGAKQLTSWRSSGNGSHKPVAWIAAHSDFAHFHYWTHSDFLPALDRCTNRQQYPRLTIPPSVTTFSTVQELALHILRNAK